MRRIIGPVLLALLAAACSRLTAENYNKLKLGMNFEEVTLLLGKPDQCNDVLAVKSCVWGDEKQGIRVRFVTDRVVAYSGENIR